jgi:hypothetical protein
LSLQGLGQKIASIPLKYTKKLNKVKFLTFALAVFLWLLRWKSAILSRNLALLGLDPQAMGPGFFRWYYRIARNFLGVFVGRSGIAIRLRARDQAKLRILQKHSSVFLTGHFHNWEALATWMVGQGIPLLGAARPLASPVFDRLLSRLRSRRGVPVVTRNILSQALAQVRAGYCFAILWDQYSTLSRHSSPFFGIPAAMDPLPEILIRRHCPNVLTGFLLPDGTFRLITLSRESERLIDPRRLSRRFHRVLECLVRRHPTYWHGLCHARFKDSVAYPGGRKVSRETLGLRARSDRYVSRETATLRTRISGQG